jgi:hypothetical protein
MPWDQGSWDNSSWDTDSITSTSTSKKKTHMTRQAYYPVRVADQIIWLTNFYLKLIGHAPALGITVARCDAAVADARWLIYILGSWLPAVRAWQKACTEAAEAAPERHRQRHPGAPRLCRAAAPLAGTACAVVARPPGGADRIFDLIQDIKESDTYTPAIGIDLGAVGAGKTPPDFATLAPVLKAQNRRQQSRDRLGLARQQRLPRPVRNPSGSRQRLRQVLTFDTTPGYTDSTPFPATPDEMEIPRHLPRGRPASRPMERMR